MCRSLHGVTEASFTVRIVSSIARVGADAWDALVGDDDPFVEHAFLCALEESGSVGAGTGWHPAHLLIEEGDRLVAAVPLYEKTHSYGEYIFDFAWANAAHRARIPYYPKLVVAVPFTPATGRRLLRASSLDARAAAARVAPALSKVCEEAGVSSVHALFLADDEVDALTAHPRFHRRETHQFRFDNPGVSSFDALLERFRSSVRKQVRRERRAVAESGLSIDVLAGEEIQASHLDRMYELYVDTCDRKGSHPYLTRAFFEIAAERLRDRMVLVTARDGARVVAASMSFEKGRHLYGRYWGADHDYDALHFELCYYRLLERAISRGYARVEAGAQGSHKLKRGFLPSVVYSAHAFAHPGLDAGVADYLAHEAEETRRVVEALTPHGPYRRDAGL